MRFAEPMGDDEMNALLEEQGQVQDLIDRTDAWNLDRMLDTAMDALRLPPSDADVVDAVGRRAAARGAVPAPPLGARPAAAGRADQPPRRRLRRLARALPRAVPRPRHGRDPRSLLPRQRRGLDPRARPRPRPAVPGQLHVLAGAEGGAPRRRGEAVRRPPPHPGARARVGAHVAPRPPGQVQGAPAVATSACWPRSSRSSWTPSRSTSRRARAWATSSSRPTTCRRGSATAC